MEQINAIVDWSRIGILFMRTYRGLLQWLQIKDQRIHGTTHEVVSERFARERPHLQTLPPRAFDTSWRVYRKVNKDCTVRFEGNSYVVGNVNRKLTISDNLTLTTP